MAFERFQKLGEERFTKIVNDLVQGKAAMALARELQQGGEFTEVPERTLTQHLNRLRKSASEGMFGTKIAQEIEQGHQGHIVLLEGVSVSALTRMEELAGWQRERCDQLMVQLREGVKAKKEFNPRLSHNKVFEDYANHLKDLQDMRFKLGLDPYTPLTGVVAKGASVTTKHPDGTETHQQVWQAVAAVEAVFERRGVKALKS